MSPVAVYPNLAVGTRHAEQSNQAAAVALVGGGGGGFSADAISGSTRWWRRVLHDALREKVYRGLPCHDS